MSAVMRVIAAGPQVSLQDAGRPGMMRFGIPLSGPMDRGAHALAAAAARRPGGVEVSRGGLALECVEGSAGFALAGGGFIVDREDGRRHGSWHCGTLRAGGRITIRPGFWGSWSMLTFCGELIGPRWMGSVATHMPSGLGGGMVRAGDELRIGDGAEPEERDLICPVWARPRRVLRVVMGPQERFFSADLRAAFLGDVFEVTDAGDRMGMRLRGPALRPQGALAIPSEPVLRGAVQVSGDGVATVLMADHQTTGGYPKIATVIGADLDALAQLRPRDKVVFRAVTPEAALAATRIRAAVIAASLAGVTRG
jgi:allophanate hydrolase